MLSKLDCDKDYDKEMRDFLLLVLGIASVDPSQVFELSIARKNGVLVQTVIHRQECLPISDISSGAMDDEEACPLLLPLSTK